MKYWNADDADTSIADEKRKDFSGLEIKRMGQG